MTLDETNELFALRRESREWKRATGFEDPEALGLYLSRQTLQEDAAMHGRVLANAFAKITSFKEQLVVARTALARVQMFGGLPGAEAMFVADALTALERLDRE